jgi:hypothetical protein
MRWFPHLLLGDIRLALPVNFQFLEQLLLASLTTSGIRRHARNPALATGLLRKARIDLERNSKKDYPDMATKLMC